MKVRQTPEARFSDLKDFPFQPHYVSINGLRMHYIDEGPADSKPLLLLHGVPSWSYLYRHMIRRISAAGRRVVAPDLIGFGKSDKPAGPEYHTYQNHIDWIRAFLANIHLENIILFGHDWGSLIGLRIAAESPELFDGIIICNGMLPPGSLKMHYTFTLWKYFSQYSPCLPVARIIGSGMTRKLGKEEKKAYNSPFPDTRYKSGIRGLPGRVPVSASDPESAANMKAWEKLSTWSKPFLTVFSDKDPVTRGGERYLQDRIPGCAGQDHKILHGGHFIQEEKSEELSNIVISFIGSTDSFLININNKPDELEMSDRKHRC